MLQPSNNPDSSSSSNGLSTANVVIIAIVIPVVVIACVVFAYFAVFKNTFGWFGKSDAYDPYTASNPLNRA
jgi:hypothetical protein